MTTMKPVLRLLLAALLGVAATALLACGSSGNGLIPASAAGPLQSDFETVAQAAQSGEGSCTATEAALAKTDQDYAALPSTIDAGLRNTLRQGISNLRSRALALCAQPLAQSTVTSTTPKTTTTPPPTTTTVTPPTTTTTTSTPPSTATTPAPTEPGPGGGTPAPGAGESESGQGGAAPGGSPSGGVGAGAGQEGAGK